MICVIRGAFNLLFLSAPFCNGLQKMCSSDGKMKWNANFRR